MNNNAQQQSVKKAFGPLEPCKLCEMLHQISNRFGEKLTTILLQRVTKTYYKKNIRVDGVLHEKTVKFIQGLDDIELSNLSFLMLHQIINHVQSVYSRRKANDIVFEILGETNIIQL